MVTLVNNLVFITNRLIIAHEGFSSSIYKGYILSTIENQYDIIWYNVIQPISYRLYDICGVLTIYTINTYLYHDYMMSLCGKHTPRILKRIF